jgi:hypothetical protein
MMLLLLGGCAGVKSHMLIPGEPVLLAEPVTAKVMIIDPDGDWLGPYRATVPSGYVAAPYIDRD